MFPFYSLKAGNTVSMTSRCSSHPAATSVVSVDGPQMLVLTMFCVDSEN